MHDSNKSHKKKQSCGDHKAKKKKGGKTILFNIYSIKSTKRRVHRGVNSNLLENYYLQTGNKSNPPIKRMVKSENQGCAEVDF
jgi:hypothetical protein